MWRRGAASDWKNPAIHRFRWVMPSRTPVVYEGRPVSAASLATLTLAPWTWAAQTMALWGMMSLSMLAPTAPRRG